MWLKFCKQLRLGPPNNGMAIRERLFDEAFMRRLERLALVARRAAMGHTQGERRSAKRGQSVEFADFRPYTSGDDFRRIDWNAYARLERLFIKLFVEEEDLTVHLLIDASQSMNWGEPNKLVYAARAAGALGYIGLTGLDRVTATAVGGANGTSAGYFAPRRGKQQAMSFFQFLQSLAPGSTPQDPSAALLGYASMRSGHGDTRPGLLILLSDLEHDCWVEGLRTLAGRGFEISVIHILSPDEADPRLDGDLKLIDSEDASEVEITADYELLARYRTELTGWQSKLRQFCLARGIQYAPVSTALPLDDLLFAWLERQGILR